MKQLKKKFLKFARKALPVFKEQARQLLSYLYKNQLALANILLSLHILSRIDDLESKISLIVPQLAALMISQLFAIAAMLGDLMEPLEKLLQIFAGSGA